MSRTDLPPRRRAAMLRDIDHGLDLLAFKLALAKGVRARGRIMAEIDELKRRKASLACR